MDEHVNELGQPVGAPVAHWQSAAAPPRTRMEGRYCHVDPFDVDAHARALHAAYVTDADHGRHWTYLAYGPFDSADAFIAWAAETTAGDDPLFHTVVDANTGAPLGLASYLRIEPASGVIEVGHIHYTPQLQRTPAATEAMYLMMRRVFDELGYRRYEWKCDALNARSRRAATRLGFSFEGIFRQATVYKGRNRDTAWYGLTDADWPRVRDAFERWLAPANFDAGGQQRESLGCNSTA